MAGAVPLKICSYDNGSFSGKVASEEREGSFWSMAAPVSHGGLSGFKPAGIQDEDTHDLTVFYPDKRGFISADNTQRWIVGQEAEGYAGMVRNTRDMNRFEDMLYRVFVSAALRVAFPSSCQPVSDLEDNRGVLKRTWMTPVHLVASIAPAYFDKSEQLKEAALGEYAFVDMKTNMMYCFRVEKCTVVPESFGGFAYKMWTWDGKGGVIDTTERRALERITIAALDFGGRTTDWMVWNRRRVVGGMYGSADFGLHQYIEAIGRDAQAANPGGFARQPTRTEILTAMRSRGKKGVLIPIRGGERMDITDIVDHQMRIMNSQAEAIYRDHLESGQGIDALLFMGGASLVVRPYMAFGHRREAFVSKDSRIVWMANAIGGLLYAMNERVLA